MLTPYQYASNSPITLIDIDGLEGTAPAPPPANNALTNTTGPNPVQNRSILPNTPHIEFQYSTKIDKGGRTTYYKTSYLYDVPITRETEIVISRFEGYTQQICQHEYVNGRQWQVIGPFGSNSSIGASSTPAPLSINENGSSDGDIPFAKSYTIPSATGGVTFTGVFNPIGSPDGSVGAVNDQITITDGVGASLVPSTGFIGLPLTINITSATNTINISIVPSPEELAATGIIAGEGDSWTLVGTLTPVPVATSPPATTPIYNSTGKARNTNTSEYINKRL